MEYMDYLGLTEEQQEIAVEALSLPMPTTADDFHTLTLMEKLAAILRRVPDMVEAYQKRGIPETVLRDTLSDIGIWMNTTKREKGEWGMMDPWWLERHLALRIFRLGRLQYEVVENAVPAEVYGNDQDEIMALCRDGMRYTQSGEADGTNGIHDPEAWTATIQREGCTIRGVPITPQGLAQHTPVALDSDTWRLLLQPGDPVLSVHIPEGEPLSRDAVLASLAQAPEFFIRHKLVDEPPKAFVCESWLLDWALDEIAPWSGIARFQRLFYCVPFAGSDAQTIERLYGFAEKEPSVHDGSTRLQRLVNDWYQRGNRCRDAWGFIPIDADCVAHPRE